MDAAAEPQPDERHVGRIDPALRACPVFASLDGAALARLADTTGRRSYGPGETVFQRGDPGDCLYVVARGQVDISLQDPDGGVAVLAVVSAPAAFGELGVVDGGPRVAAATARGATELIRVPQATLAQLLATEPAVAMAVLSSLVAMVRQGDQKVADLSLRRLHHRVRRHLMHACAPWLATAEQAPGAVVKVDLPINQTDLARQVGGSRQQVNRILAELDATGTIARKGRRIVSIRPDRLTFED